MSRTFSQIVFYTRPWEVHFHIELGRALQEYFGGTSVKYATFFVSAYREVRDAGFDCWYLPDEFNGAMLWATLEEHAMKIDKELRNATGIGLGLMLQSERFLPRSKQDLQRFVGAHVVVLDRHISEGTLSVSSMYDHFVYWLGGALANIRGGAHFAFVASGVPGGRVVGLKTPWEAWENPRADVAESDLMLERIRSSFAKPPEKRIEYMRPLAVPPFRHRWKTRLQELRDEYYDRRMGSYFARVSLASLLASRVRRGRGLARLNELFDITSVSQIPSDRFVYVPLHMEPEASILMYSPWVRDQAELVRLVSASVPYGMKILVKENPKMMEAGRREFLERLKGIPGVQLVHPSCPSLPFIAAAACTVSLAGTASLEAVLIGRDGLVLGTPPFSIVRPAMRVSSPSELYQRVNRAASEDIRVDVDRTGWVRWLRSTFVANAVPRFRETGKGQLYEVDSSPANVQAYAEYITGCLATSVDACSQ